MTLLCEQLASWTAAWLSLRGNMIRDSGSSHDRRSRVISSAKQREISLLSGKQVRERHGLGKPGTVPRRVSAW
jgi:hypothetical protein